MHYIFYTNHLIPARFAAETYGPFIFIRPSYLEDKGLLHHELMHVKQFWHNPFFGIRCELLRPKGRSFLLPRQHPDQSQAILPGVLAIHTRTNNYLPQLEFIAISKGTLGHSSPDLSTNESVT